MKLNINLKITHWPPLIGLCAFRGTEVPAAVILGRLVSWNSELGVTSVWKLESAVCRDSMPPDYQLIDGER